MNLFVSSLIKGLEPLRDAAASGVVSAYRRRHTRNIAKLVTPAP